MSPSLDRGRTGVAAAVRPDTRRRPVLLATLDVPVDADAARVAVDSAVESGQPLVIANVVPTAFVPVVLANWDYLPRPEVEESLRRPAELARSLGVEVERLRVRSPHPVDALLEVAAELEPALLVFGPDRTRLRGRRYRKAARSIEQRCACLVWLA
jgi:nucleotide-binding universal stress UspA family protein